MMCLRNDQSAKHTSFFPGDSILELPLVSLSSASDLNMKLCIMSLIRDRGADALWSSASFGIGSCFASPPRFSVGSVCCNLVVRPRLVE